MASSPKIPDPNQALVAGTLANAGTFPFQQYIDYLAQTGGAANIGGTNYNFTGLGNAAQSAALSNVMLPAELQIQQQYGPQYTALASQNLEQANPNAVAARQQEGQQIISDAENPPGRPMASDVQDQILALAGLGSNLTTGPNSETEAVQQGVRGQQVANGIYLGNAPAAQEAAAVVNAGDQQQQQRQSQALQFLQSGISPEDVTYRRVQQSLSNLGNFVNSQTPEAQFGSLSGASQGAAPFNTMGAQGAQQNPNAGLAGMQNAAELYSGNVNWVQNQANPWTAGLSSLAGSASLLNNSGMFSQNGLFGSNGPLASAPTVNYGQYSGTENWSSPGPAPAADPSGTDWSETAPALSGPAAG